MSVPMFDCRNLIEFCRAFERHHNHTFNPNPDSSTRTRRLTSESLNPFSNEFCHRSPFAALDLILLLSVVGSLGYLIISYFKFFFRDVLPTVHRFVTNLVSDAPLACSMGVIGFVVSLLVWEMIDFRLRRKCRNRNCKGLRRAVEYDIQLEPEECIGYVPPVTDSCGDEDGLELRREERDELKAELKKMAPPNGRTVLIFRARCGCPIARLEVWGPKKVRRIKK